MADKQLQDCAPNKQPTTHVTFSGHTHFPALSTGFVSHDGIVFFPKAVLHDWLEKHHFLTNQKQRQN